jgi:hypothetical protein
MVRALMHALLLALAVSAPAFDCPPEQRLKLDLKQWAAYLKAAKPGSPEQRAAVRALGFPDVPSGSDQIPEDECAKKPALKALHLTDSKLTGKGDRTVQARFEMCGPGPEHSFISQRIAVIVPLGDGSVCKLAGEDLSKDQAAIDAPCATKSSLPRTVRFVKLTNPLRNVLEVRDQRGSCTAKARGGETRMALYEAHGAALDRIFENKLWELADDGQTPPVEQTVWKLAYGKTLPKTIDVTRQTSCLNDPQHLCTADSAVEKYVYSPAPAAAYVRTGDMQ